MRREDKFVIITSINKPGAAVSAFANWAGWQVVVVGDRKTPRDWFCENVTFLGIEDQLRDRPGFANRIPENSYVRKMFGYIHAIRSGASMILDTDDDNLPYPGAADAISVLAEDPGGAGVARVGSDCGWLNVYAAFGAPACWPRGFPLEFVRDPKTRGRPGEDSKAWAVAQFLVNDDPDVDALYRLIVGDPIRFIGGRTLVLAEGTFCPFNSQATLWLPEAFPLLFLPMGVSDRVADILRGYISLACLWRMNRSVAYSSPLFWQERNPHRLLDDFRQEVPLYLDANRIAQTLVDPEGESPSSCYRSCLSRLEAMGAVPAGLRETYQHFLDESGLK